MMSAQPNLADLRAAFSQALGVDAPIPEPALKAIAADPTYARRLFAARGAPQMLALMLDYPPEITRPPTIAAVVAGAASALAKWTQSGFAVVDEARLLRRLSACRTCPQLVEAASMLHRLAGVGTRDDRVCHLCGCTVERKARLPHENCPAPDPRDGTLSRWGENIAG